MTSAKLATLGLPKLKTFRSKGYDAIICDNDVTRKIITLDSNYDIELIK